ncbi:protein O-mannosyl-transferase family [Flavobacterium sp.]|uniref:protein O-mannosyl-transferase family n=1 Tax=Flavobacterium sp. TaxID=239 RepID=UPI004034C1C5
MTNQDFRKWNMIAGWCLFATALIVYCLTVERTLSFWDCGEYIATAAKLEVGHPPGAPLFQIIGAFFSMFATADDKIALMVNMVSVMSSAFTILFMFWSLTILLKNLVSSFAEFNKNNAIMVLGSSAIGTLAFLFSDSFWFNATEAEVYAMASLFIALLFWAGLRWGEEIGTPRANRWLLLISLLLGLSFGVHFLALLTIPSIGLIYFFKNYKTVTVKNFIIANAVTIAILFFVFKFLLPYTMALFGRTEIFMVNSFGLPFNSGTIFMFVLLASLFYFGLRYTKKNNKPFLNTILLCVLFLFIGFSTWMMLPIRANAEVVINENKPSDAAELLAYYNREQYGEQKTFFGPLYTEIYSGLDKEHPYKDAKPNYQRDYASGTYKIVNNYKNAKQNPDETHSAILPRMTSTDHAANYMSFSGPPNFRIDPNYDYAGELLRYGIDVETLEPQEAAAAIAQIQGELEAVINEFRSAYAKGDVGFKEYDKFLKHYKNYLIVEKPSFGDNMSYMFDYQFGYMYWRYLMWNFTGRQNDVQGEMDNNGNWLSGITFIDEMRLGPQQALTSDMKNNKGRNVYFFLPFILGIIGAVYHARKDLKSFYVLLALFLFMGIALKIFLNERPFEVRERDYVLVGSYYVFAMWIAFGVYAIYDGIKQYLAPKISVPVVLGVTLLAAPVLMASQNWDDHDRSGRYTALSMAKAYLDSCEPNAILFTVGDNDTFPLWYAQEIEGFRTDVRIVCSTLLPTDWYIDQMKRKAYKSDPVPISLKHDQYVDGTRDFLFYNPRGQKKDSTMTINDFMTFVTLEDDRAKVPLSNDHLVNYYPINKIRFPIDKETIIRNKVVSPQRYDSIVPFIEITLPEEAIYKHNLVMLDIIRTNNWKRPIYFAGGRFDDEDYAWMKDYLQLEGMIYKLVPVKTAIPENGSPLDMGYIDTDDMYNIVMKWDWGNGGDTGIYHDPQTQKNSISFRKNLARLGDALVKEGNIDKARNVIDVAIKNMPLDQFGYYFISEPFAGLYYQTGQKKQAREFLTKLIGKYNETLNYYKSLPVAEQNAGAPDIMGSIEAYRTLLIIMEENNDMEFFEASKVAFNKANGMFARFKRPNE